MNIVAYDPQGVFNAYGFWYRFPVMGLLYIAQIWRGLGHAVTVFSEAIHGRIYEQKNGRFRPDFLAAIKKADVFAASVMTATANRCYTVARAVRKINPKIRIIFGGPHVTYQDDDLDFPCTIVRGEGELLAAQSLEVHSGVLDTPNLLEDLNTLAPPDFSLLPGYQDWLAGKTIRGWPWWEKRLPRIFPVLGSRGCPFNCNFCIVTQMHGGRYRFREPGAVVEEIKSRIRDGARPQVFFNDDNIGARQSWLAELCEGMIREIIEKMDLPNYNFRGEARVDIALGQNYREMLHILKRARCKFLLIGFESINPETLVGYHKHQTLEDIRLCIQRLKAFGLGIHGMFAVGADEDNQGTAVQTARFALRQGIDTVQFSALFPIPGTKLHRTLEEEDRILTRDWDLYDGSTVVFRPKKMSAVQSQAGFLAGWQEFYRHRLNLLPVALLGKRLWLRAHGRRFREMLSKKE